MDMNFKQQSQRKFKRVERLMKSGLLEGYAQRVKVSFDFLDIGNNGWFALKDLTERGNHISSYLGLGLDLSSTFSIMDAFRSFDVGIRGRVRLEDFGVSLIIRLLSYDDNFFNNLAHDSFDAGFTSVAKFLSSISGAKSKNKPTSRTSAKLTATSKIFSAVPFASVDEDEKDDDDEPGSGGGGLAVPESLLNAFGTIFYLLEDTLVNISGSTETDASLTVEVIEKALRDAFLLACRELKIQLQLSQAYIEKVWSEKGHDLNDQTKSLAQHWDPEDNKHRTVNLEMLWKPPRKTEFGTRVQFEMTDATSLKAQFRRSGSILASGYDGKPIKGRGGRDSAVFESVVGKNDGNINEEEAGSASDMRTFSLDHLMLEDQPPLDSSQLFVLKSAIQNIDNFFTILQNPSLPINKEKQEAEKKQDDASLSRSRFTIQGSNGNRKVTHEQMSIARAKQLQDNAADGDPASKKQLDSELSLELMDTQDKLRRTTARLEILEIIQMEISQNAAKVLKQEEEAAAGVAAAKLEKLTEESVESESDNNEDTEGKDEDDDDENSSDRSPKPVEIVVEVKPEVSFDEIMHTVQEVRALVSQRGSENMITGSLLTTPSAILPLQDIDDNKKSINNSKSTKQSSGHDGFGEEKTQSHSKGILSKSSNLMDNTTKGRSNRKIQVASLLHLMNSSIMSISEEMNSRDKNTGDLEKMQLMARNNEEKAAEAAILSEQLSRQDDSAAALAVEVQVLRDRIQHVSAMEYEIDNLKEKNLHLNRKVKDLERSISERKEGWNLDNLMADGEDIEGSSKTLVDLENKVLTLKEVNNDLKGVNAKLMKEQHQHIMASKNAEKRLKLCLQDNLGLNQKMNRLEEDFNNSKIEVSDLLGQIEHQRDTEQERLQVAKKLHTTGLAVTELRGKLLEAKAEALHANKLRDELAIAETRVSKLMEAASEAEITSDSNLSAKQEVEELNVLLREKMRENRELSITARSLERKVNEGRTVQARLHACQDEVNRYKIKVEQCAPMLAEVARLRGAARAAVRSLQEQDKTIVTAEDANKKLRKKLEETTIALKRMEKIEYKLIESESECARLSDIVLTEIPQLKEELANTNTEKSQIETQYRHIKKSSRQSAVTGTGMKDLSSGAPSSSSSSSSSNSGAKSSSSAPSPSLASRKQSMKASSSAPSTSSPSLPPPPPKKAPPPPSGPPGKKLTPPSPGPPAAKKALPPPPKKEEKKKMKEEEKTKPPPPKVDGGSSMAKNKEALLAKFKPPVAPPAAATQSDKKTPPPPPPAPTASKEEKKSAPPPPPSSSSSSSSSAPLPEVDEGVSMADNKAALMSLFKPR